MNTEDLKVVPTRFLFAWTDQRVSLKKKTAEVLQPQRSKTLADCLLVGAEGVDQQRRVSRGIKQ